MRIWPGLKAMGCATLRDGVLPQRTRIDCLACAWLILRFIDAKLRLIWLANIADCPVDATGFYFDDAAFTHIDALM